MYSVRKYKDPYAALPIEYNWTATFIVQFHLCLASHALRCIIIQDT